MQIIVTRNKKVMATYPHDIPEEWKKQMKKAGCKIKEVKDK